MHDPPRATHKMLAPCDLATSLAVAGPGGKPDGFYDVTTNERVVTPGADHASAVARMVSFHEAYHAYLNQTTSYGTALILAGSLADAGFDRFLTLVRHMVSRARVPHELYATTLGVFAANRGVFNDSMLVGYPAYRDLFARASAVFDFGSYPVAASIAFDACLRSVFQTDVLDRWNELPCERWDLDAVQQSDPAWRLEQVLARALAGRAMDGLGRVARQSLGGLQALFESSHSPESQLRSLRQAPPDERMALQDAAFEVFACELSPSGNVRTIDSHRDLVQELVSKVERFAAGGLRTRFLIPNPGDDSPVFRDFTRERLVLRDSDYAVSANLASVSDSTLESFIITTATERYVQLAAMPGGKARSLYRNLAGGEIFPGISSETVTFLRRRARTPGLSCDHAIELLLVPAPETLEARLRDCANDVAVFPIVSASTLASATWREKWITPGSGRADVMAVLVDTDPFELLDEVASSASDVQCAWIKLARNESALPEMVSVLVFAPADSEGVFYFRPCSTSLIAAVEALAGRTMPNVRFSDELIQRWGKPLQRATSHATLEESRFGTRFWE